MTIASDNFLNEQERAYYESAFLQAEKDKEVRDLWMWIENEDITVKNIVKDRRVEEKKSYLYLNENNEEEFKLVI